MKKIETMLLNRIKEIDPDLMAVYLKGSKIDGRESDYWSDLDLLLVSGASDIHIAYTEMLDEIFHPIHAKQLYLYENCITYRVTSGLASVVQFDIQVVNLDFFNKYESDLLLDVKQVYGEKRRRETARKSTVEYAHQYNEESINNSWFLFYEAVKKIARCDNLIGLHLVFDLIREYLVLEMVDRDIAKGTNIHRYGTNEKLPDELDMRLLQTESSIDKLKFIAALSLAFDSKLSQLHKGYMSRCELFAEHINRSIALIKKA